MALVRTVRDVLRKERQYLGLTGGTVGTVSKHTVQPFLITSSDKRTCAPSTVLGCLGNIVVTAV